MEEKISEKRYNSLWSFSSFRNLSTLFLGNRKNNNSYLKSLKKSGFTLVELVVVIAMLAILFSVFVGILNPFSQLQKSNDAQTKQDLEQIKTALDLYYYDNNCYPSSLPFNQAFTGGNTIYIRKVPQSVNCSNLSGRNNCYLYQTDGSVCPAWFVLYAKLGASSVASNNGASINVACPLASLNSCLPTNYTSLGYNYCVEEGAFSCGFISKNPMPTYAPYISPTPTVIPPSPTPSCQRNYACTGGPPARCNVVYPPGSGTYCVSNCNGACP